MHHALLMRVLHRRAHLPHQQQPILQRELLVLAEAIERHGLHVIHREERLPAVGRPAVEDLGDALVVHQCQRLPLLLEARDDGLAVHAQLDQLQRVASPDWFALLGEIDRAHAAFAEAIEDRARTDVSGAVVGGARALRLHRREAIAGRSWGNAAGRLADDSHQDP